MYKNESGQKLYVFAWDSVANIPKTGDAANISVKISKDGAAQASLDDSSATEIGDGVYVFDLLQAETNAAAIAFTGSSTTAGVMVDPTLVYTRDVSAVWGVVMENGKTYAEVMRVFAAVLSGKSTTASGVITFKGIDGLTSRLVVSVSDGNRDSVDGWDGT